MNLPFAHLLHAVEQQRFSGCLSHACLKHSSRCRCLDHLVNTVDTIGRRPLVDYHMYMPKVRVPMKQPRGSNEERGLARIQR
jgi:hypothetical protein